MLSWSEVQVEIYTLISVGGGYCAPVYGVVYTSHVTSSSSTSPTTPSFNGIGSSNKQSRNNNPGWISITIFRKNRKWCRGYWFLKACWQNSLGKFSSSFISLMSLEMSPDPDQFYRRLIRELFAVFCSFIQIDLFFLAHEIMIAVWWSMTGGWSQNGSILIEYSWNTFLFLNFPFTIRL